MGDRHARPPQPTHVRWVQLCAWTVLLALASGCDPVFWRDARITDIVPGGNIATGQLDCGLTLEFIEPPDDPLDVLVRFDSMAMASPMEFDWSFIAGRDVRTKGGAFGSGHSANGDTTASDAPPLGVPIRVRFPLHAKEYIEMGRVESLYLTADLYWGGVKHHSVRRTINHIYQPDDGSFL